MLEKEVGPASIVKACMQSSVANENGYDDSSFCVFVPNDQVSVDAADGSVASTNDDVSSLGATWMGDLQLRDLNCKDRIQRESLKIIGVITFYTESDPSSTDIEQAHELSKKKAPNGSSSGGCLPDYVRHAPVFLKVILVTGGLVLVASIVLLTIVLIQAREDGKEKLSSWQGIDLDSYKRATPVPTSVKEEHNSTSEPAQGPGQDERTATSSPTPLPVCEDQQGTFGMNETQFTCPMVNSSAIFRNIYCTKGFKSFDLCPKTCNNCR